jgi:cyclohexanecarboxyl-CoA dehydrogenase
MEFRFSPLEEDLRSAVMDFVQREMSDREFDSFDHIPTDLIKKMGDLGFFSIKIPDEYGGQPGSWVEIGLLTEEIAKGDANVAHLIMVSYGINLLLAMYAEREVMEAFLTNLAKGRKIGCIALTESEAGSDVAAINTRAIKDGDYYRINGRKEPVSFGMQADYTVLFAKTDRQSELHGVTAFLVPLNIPGIKKAPINTMGLKSSAPASFMFDDTLVPVPYRLGGEGEGLELNSDLGLFSNVSRILSGLICLGTAQSALRQAVAYAKKRIAFGRPIAQFEGVSGKIAEDVTLIEAGKWLCYRGLSLKDRGLPNDEEAAMCGWWCPTIAFQVIENALLIHGHAGYSVDHPFQKMLRDITAFEFIPGTAEVLKRIIARRVIGNVAIPNELEGIIA